MQPEHRGFFSPRNLRHLSNNDFSLDSSHGNTDDTKNSINRRRSSKLVATKPVGKAIADAEFPLSTPQIVAAQQHDGMPTTKSRILPQVSLQPVRPELSESNMTFVRSEGHDHPHGDMEIQGWQAEKGLVAQDAGSASQLMQGVHH